MRTGHLQAAHALWRELIRENDIVIDATAGNGHDTLVLSHLIKTGKLYAVDIQEKALMNTRERIESANPLCPITYVHSSHEYFPNEIPPHSVKLIVYNLGYLPGGDKQLTTKTSSTLTSLTKALSLLMPEGAISVMLYPGHEEGAKEAKAVLAFANALPKDTWNINHTVNCENHSSPSLLWIQAC